MGVLGNCWEPEKRVLRAAHPRTPFQGEYPPGSGAYWPAWKCFKNEGHWVSICFEKRAHSVGNTIWQKKKKKKKKKATKEGFFSTK